MSYKNCILKGIKDGLISEEQALRLNKNLEKENSKKSKNLADDIDFLEFDQMTNWIAVKKFTNYIFSELNKIN